MSILRYAGPGGPQLGVLLDGGVAPLDLDLGPLEGVEALFAAGDLGVRVARAQERAERLPLDALVLLAPIPRPSKIVAIGLNYADHVAESGLPMPEVPPVFAKFSNSVVGPGEAILRPRVSVDLDYEGELGIVIGRECRYVPRERAHEVVGGYTIVNDVSVRDVQLQTQHWSLGKSFDTHCPMGPWVTLADDLDPSDLRLRTWINDELRQDSSTKELVFGVAELIERLSAVCTLYPGDVIATGTPGGVGGAMSPPNYLVPGDEVRIEIEGLGVLVNPVEAEPADLGRIGEEVLAFEGEASR
jgi:2-keto-4-pentenoate hydratase/2-oxohepta-3-ene-1,7-dioic acid hydratase in catechol pathway